MKVVAAQRVKRAGTGEWWLCVILHTDVLTNFQLTGADVEGMEDDDLIAAGSIICTPTANYIAYEDGTFAQSQIAGSGGGGGGGTAGVSTFNGRSGAVIPRTGDYNAQKINTNTAGKSVQDLLDELQALTTIDIALSTSSEKAVQNKVVTQAINELRGMTLPQGGNAGDLLAKIDNNDYNVEWVSQNNFMLKSQYDTDNNGRVDKSDTSYSVTGPTNYTAIMKNTSGNTYLVTDDEKGKRNGVVPLDSNRKILPEFLPDNITAGLTYGGIFNATTRVVRLTPAAKSILGISADTMTLQNSSQVPEGYPANAELFYITTVADEFAGMNFAVGDWLISLATEWQQLANGSAVSSVNGQTGAVQLNSDDITQGTNNLYMSVAERNKLQNIEVEATKDVNVVQQAQIVTTAGGERVLRLTNKNGTVVDFEGASIDPDQYLRTNGNASNTYVVYNTSGSRQTFTGNEAMQLFASKVAIWLNALETVAFSGSYLDLRDKPTKTSQFTNDGYNGTDPYVTRTVNTLSNYYLKTQTYTKDEIDQKIDAIEGFEFIQVAELPTTNINDHAIYYVPNSGGSGYNRYQHMNGQWLFLGSTDVSMTGYLEEDGNSSHTTVTFTSPVTREIPVTDEELGTIIEKLVQYCRDLKNVCFTASWHDLEDSAELATQDDLDEKVDKHYSTTDEGKLLGINGSGDVALVDAPDGAMRRGVGPVSMIGNDTKDNPINVANGSRATAIGFNTQANGVNQFVDGRYNAPDNVNAYAEITGGGSAGALENIKTLDWGGKLWTKGGVSVGNNSDNIIPITQGNDLTTKNYVDNHVEEAIASANLLKSMVVTVVPDVEDADDNILYLIADPTQEDTYIQYKKVLESQDPDVYVMARLGTTQMSTNTTQVTELPTPSVGYKNAVYQYIGSASNYDFGMFYTCKDQNYYAWLNTTDAKNYYTTSPTPTKYSKIYNENFVWDGAYVDTLSGNTMTDTVNKTYTRLNASDTSQYEWQILNDKLSEYENDGRGSGAPNDFYITKADLLDMVYPVGAIYISVNDVNPTNFLGGNWEKISGRFLLASSTDYTLGSTGGTKENKLLRSDLPKVTITTSSDGSHTHSTRGYYGIPGGSNNQVMARKAVSGDPLDTNNPIQSAGSHTHTFYLNGDVAQTSFSNLPPYLAVSMYKRVS